MKPSFAVLLALCVPLSLVGQTKFQTDVQAIHPLAYWPLGQNFNDISGNAHNGAVNQNGNVPFLNGPALGVPGANCCTAANFTGGSFVMAPPGGGLNFGATQPFTIFAWIRTVQLQGGSPVIAAKYDAVANAGWGLLLDNGDFSGVKGGGRVALVFVHGDSNILAVESSTSVNDGFYHFIAATYDGSGLGGGVQIYIDGQRVAPTIASDTLSGNSIVNAAPFTIGNTLDNESPFEGSIGQVGVVGSVLSSNQITQLAEDANVARAVLSQFAFGGGWYSALYLKNTSTVTGGSVSFQVSFTSDTGTPLTVPSIGGSSTTVTLASGASTLIEAPNVGSLVQGYVTVDLPIQVTGYGVFRQSVPGIADQEAVVPLEWPYAGFNSLVYDDTNNLVTAAAIVNATPQAATITATAFDATGAQIGTSTVMLPAFNKTAVVLRNLPGLSQIAGQRGSVVFGITASTGGVAVLGLRFDGSAFSSIPSTIGFQLARFPGYR